MKLIKLYKYSDSFGGVLSKHLAVIVDKFEIVVVKFSTGLDNINCIDFFITYDIQDSEYDNKLIEVFNEAIRNNIHCDSISRDSTSIEIVNAVFGNICDENEDIKYISNYRFDDSFDYIPINSTFYLKYVNIIGNSYSIILFETNEKIMESNKVIMTLHGGELIDFKNRETGGYNEILRKN